MTVRVGLRRIGVTGRSVTLDGAPLKLKGFNRHDAHPDYAALPYDVMLKWTRWMVAAGAASCAAALPAGRAAARRRRRAGPPRGGDHRLGRPRREPEARDGSTASCLLDAMISASFNHPSVYGLPNEADTAAPASELAFGFAAAMRARRTGRLPTWATNKKDCNIHLADLLSVNDYPGWYAARRMALPSTGRRRRRAAEHYPSAVPHRRGRRRRDRRLAK